jgi:insulysin
VEYSYDAEIAGLSYQVSTMSDALVLSVSGYNDKLDVLLKVVLEKIKELQVDPQRFELIKDRVSCFRKSYLATRANPSSPASLNAALRISNSTHPTSLPTST